MPRSCLTARTRRYLFYGFTTVITSAVVLICILALTNHPDVLTLLIDKGLPVLVGLAGGFGGGFGYSEWRHKREP